MRPKAGAGARCETGHLPDGGDFLTGEAPTEDVHRWHDVPVDGGDVSEVGGIRPVVGENASHRFVDFREPDRAGIEDLLDGQVESALTGEQRPDPQTAIVWFVASFPHEHSGRSVIPGRRPLMNSKPGWSPARCSPWLPWLADAAAPDLSTEHSSLPSSEPPRVLQIEDSPTSVVRKKTMLRVSEAERAGILGNHRRREAMDVRPEWQGTAQHGEALDLSRWLVHLTRSEEDLISILTTGMIEARAPFGAGRYYSRVQHLHRSVCLTETPLHELERMTARRPWGIVFDKERLRLKLGAQPVWYLSDPSPQWRALRAAMVDAADMPNAPIWQLTPYIDGVRDRQSKRPNDWRWEREWRVRGDLEFELSDVSMIVSSEAGATAILDEVSVGLPWVSPDGGRPQWAGGFTEGWDAAIEQMLDRFHMTFTSPDNAGMPWDSEDNAYVQLVEFHDTAYAMDEVFGYLMPDLYEAIESALNNESDQWCRTYDHEHWGD